MRSAWLIANCILRRSWAIWQVRCAYKLREMAMMNSFHPKFVSLVSPITLNYIAGGPEYPHFYSDAPESRWRRYDKAALLKPDLYCKSVARSSLMQMAEHWTTLPIARNLAARYHALRNAYMMVGRRHEAGKPLAESAQEFIGVARKQFDRFDSGSGRIHNKRVPINGDVAMLRWADDARNRERTAGALFFTRGISLVTSVP